MPFEGFILVGQTSRSHGLDKLPPDNLLVCILGASESNVTSGRLNHKAERYYGRANQKLLSFQISKFLEKSHKEHS